MWEDVSHSIIYISLNPLSAFRNKKRRGVEKNKIDIQIYWQPNIFLLRTLEVIKTSYIYHLHSIIVSSTNEKMLDFEIETIFQQAPSQFLIVHKHCISQLIRMIS